jgi:hypothetical protein
MKLSDFEKYRTGNIIEAKVNVTPCSQNLSIGPTTTNNLGLEISAGTISISLLSHECNMTLYDLMSEYRNHQLSKPRKPKILGKGRYQLIAGEWELVERKFKQILSKIEIKFLDEAI